MKILPNYETAFFIVCEDFRQEVGHKTSLMGIFANNELILGNAAGSVLVPSLILLLILRGGNGPFKQKITILDPSGAVAFDLPEDDVVMETGKAHYAMAKLLGVPLHVGVYTVRFAFDGHEVIRTFETKSS
jgi:hypothetical protein